MTAPGAITGSIDPPRPPRPPVILSARGLRKHFGGVAALDDFSLDLERGQVRCIVGPNGAGKSTLFKVLSGLIPSDAGSVLMFGTDVTGSGARKIAALGVAIKLQIPRIFPTLTVRQHLQLGARKGDGPADLLGLRRSSAREREEAGIAVLDHVGLDVPLARLASDLGHGERQWLEIAMLLATQPTILLLDEPGAGMSIDDKGKLIGLLRSIVGDTSTILIEHDLEFVSLVADDVMVLHRGQLLTTGSFDEISSDPRVRSVYLDSTPP